MELASVLAPTELLIVGVGLIAVSVIGLMIAIYCNSGNPFGLDEGDEVVKLPPEKIASKNTIRITTPKPTWE